MRAGTAVLIGFGIFGVNRLQRAEWADPAHAFRSARSASEGLRCTLGRQRRHA
jgi:hypothetical protein